MANEGMLYNNPAGGTQSTISDKQLVLHAFQRKALIDAREEQYFGQLADVTSMPKNSGKRITRYHYIPLLDDENVNSQGIDAKGATIVNGNLYGSSKDIGNITSKMPTLSETGGRVNRVGFRRKDLEGTFAKFGFFTEYSADSLNFDSDAELLTHINREMVNGAMKLTEDALQADLLNNAGTVKYPGNAVSNATMQAGHIVTYQSLMRLAIDLDNNKTPKSTKMITGTQYTDTRTIAGGRVMYVGSELIPTLEAMQDSHGRPAFVPVHQYAAGTTVLKGEVGSIYQFRIIVVPSMQKWAGAGATASDNSYYATNGKYDVFPMLVVGDESFTTIGFQTNGKELKFDITHKKPGKETADKNDPFGEMGFISIKWWYGFMLLRGERLAVLKTLAKV